MIQVTITTPPELERVLAGLTAAQGDAIGNMAAQQVAPAFTRALVEKSGELAGFGPSGFSRGWIAEAAGPSIAVTNTSPLARDIELPTAPHIIEARPGGVLAWPIKPGQAPRAPFLKSIASRRPFSAKNASKAKAASDWFFAKRVHHPGTKGKFVFPATVEEQTDMILGALATAARTVLGG